MGTPVQTCLSTEASNLYNMKVLGLVLAMYWTLFVTGANALDPYHGCRPRTHVGACPWLPNGGSRRRKTCLTATDNRPQFAGQECVWCEKDCQGKHQCEVKSYAQPIENYANCSPEDCRPRINAGACPWLPYGGSWSKLICLMSTDNRPQFAGQECVWCEKDCQGKHQCEVKSYAQPIANYANC